MASNFSRTMFALLKAWTQRRRRAEACASASGDSGGVVGGGTGVGRGGGWGNETGDGCGLRGGGVSDPAGLPPLGWADQVVAFDLDRARIEPAQAPAAKQQATSGTPDAEAAGHGEALTLPPQYPPPLLSPSSPPPLFTVSGVEYFTPAGDRDWVDEAESKGWLPGWAGGH